MTIKGKVKSVSARYPYTVTMKSGKMFISHFQFAPGMIIRLPLDDNEVFDSPWPSAFIYCRPNGFRTYGPISEERIATIKSPVNSLPTYVKRAILEGPQKWSMDWSFYKYFYTCTFDPATRTVTTNYAFQNI